MSINCWFEKTSLGEQILQVEDEILQQVLSQVFGYYLLQLNCVGSNYWLPHSRITHRTVLCTKNNHHSLFCDALIEADRLPFSAESIDAIILPHVLEYERQPHGILREVDRILTAQGHLIIIGFNPLSLWGVRARLLPNKIIHQGKFISIRRLRDWLSLLGFEITQEYHRYITPLFHTEQAIKYNLGAKLGQKLPQLADMYVVVAKKNRMITPSLRFQWKTKSMPDLDPIAEPSIRHANKEVKT
jgi:SAM-dependent methyltransferase